MKKGFLLFASLLFAQFSYATIQYTFVPSESISGGTTIRSYDLDSDGDDDFAFEYFSNGVTFTDSVVVRCLKPTSFYAAAGTTGNTVKAFVQNAGLGTYHWENSNGTIANSDGGAPFNNTTKFLQVKFSDATNTYYGWIEINGQSHSSIYIRGYAYNDVPDEAIAAGQTTGATGIEEINVQAFALSNITNSSVSFQNTQAYDEVMIATVDGRVVTTIAGPVAGQQYAFQQTSGVVLVSYFNKGKKVSAGKYLVQ